MSYRNCQREVADQSSVNDDRPLDCVHILIDLREKFGSIKQCVVSSVCSLLTMRSKRVERGKSGTQARLLDAGSVSLEFHLENGKYVRVDQSVWA